MLESRHPDTAPAVPAEGWTLERLTPPSRLFGANGLRTGPDGRVHVAQVAGSRISALDVATGELETVSPEGSDIVAPDDLAFDDRGDLYVTEYYDGRVSVRTAGGATRVLRDDVPGANGITFHRGRLFVDECRIGGRLLELGLDGGEPRVLAADLPMPNALEAGPDGKLYYPVLGTNDIWRIDPDGGEPERVVGDLGVPVAVKFDAAGFIVSPQVATGEVLRIDPRSGERTVLASLAPGLDNLTFVGDRLFVSSFTGAITEILLDGAAGATRAVLPNGLTWPLDLAVDGDGVLHVADGTYLYALAPGGTPETLAMLFSPGWPGYVRGLQAGGAGELVVTTSNGQVARYRPASSESEVLADGLDQLYGLAVTPGGAVVVAEQGTGRVLSAGAGSVEALATGLDRPSGVAAGPAGTVLVAESGAGRVVAVGSGGAVDTVVDGLEEPQGIAVHGGRLHVVDAGAKTLVAVDLDTKARHVLARGLPVGAPAGVTLKPLQGLAPFSGPQGRFAGVTAGPDGTLYVSADAEGSVLALRPAR